MSLDTKTLKDEAQRLIDIQSADPRMGALYRHEYLKVATPEAVLALIADNERLTKAVGLQVIRRFVGDDDQKKIDELVAAGIQVDKELIVQLKAENERLEVEVKRMTSIAYAAHGAFRMETMAERDQLRAEVAGLKTGYEAYERVNAELKAENERLVPFEEAYRTACNVRNRLINEGEELRKALAECVDSLQGEMLQKFGGQLPEDMHPVTRRDYDRDMAELAGYRAAIGKGEQS